jgi:hypothetical protein
VTGSWNRATLARGLFVGQAAMVSIVVHTVTYRPTKFGLPIPSTIQDHRGGATGGVESSCKRLPVPGIGLLWQEAFCWTSGHGQYCCKHCTASTYRVWAPNSIHNPRSQRRRHRWHRVVNSSSFETKERDTVPLCYSHYILKPALTVFIRTV